MSHMKNTEYAESLLDSLVPPGFRQIPSFRSYAVNEAGTEVVSIAKWHDKRMDERRSAIYTKGPYAAEPSEPTDDLRELYNVTEREGGPYTLSPHIGSRMGYTQYHLQACPLDARFKPAEFPSRAEWVRDNISPDAKPWDHHEEYMKARRSISKRNSNLRHVHRLVFEAWGNEPLKKGYHIDHIDGDKTNNHIDNLRQVTPFENIHNPNTFKKHVAQISKLTESQVHDIRDQWDSRPKTLKLKDLKAQLATHYGVSQANIEAIGYRKSWRHLPEKDGSPMRTPQKRIKKGEAQ